jgi:predicted permease
MESLLQDIRFGLRLLRRNPGFTLVAVLTLALAIGANTAIFSVVDALLLRPLPLRDADRVVVIMETHPAIPKVESTMLDYLDWKQQAKAFEEMAAYSFKGFRGLSLVEGGEPEQVAGVLVSQNLLPMMGITPLLGRNFLPEEVEPGHDNEVLVSYALWRNRFHADPMILGKSIQIQDQKFTVIGVMSAEQAFPAATDLWLPLSRLSVNDRTNRAFHSLVVLARRRPSAGAAAAEEEMRVISGRLQAAYPDTNKSIGVNVTPLREHLLGDMHATLVIVFSAVGLILLIVCANIANLLLAQAARRDKEIGLRIALGSARRRLVRQFITEGMVLAVCGGVVAVLITALTIPALRHTLTGIADQMPFMDRVTINGRILMFSFLVTLLAGFLFSLFPAIRVLRSNMTQAMQQEGRGYSSQQVLRDILVVSEIALAIVVLVSSGLLTRTLQRLLSTDLGFRTERLVTAQLNLPRRQYSDDTKVSNFYKELLRKVELLPGVTQAATVDVLPLVPSRVLTRFAVSGLALPEPGKYPIAQLRTVSPRYFEVMGVPLKRGRAFTEQDLSDPNGFFIVNETFAERFLAGQDPLRQKILVQVETDKPIAMPIIGLVADVKDLGPDSAPQPELYQPGFLPHEVLLVKTEVSDVTLASSLRHEVSGLDSNLPVYKVATIREVLAGSLARRKFSVQLLGLFSLLALILSAAGVYGLLSYSVAQRTREIGTRIALGAEKLTILLMVIKQTLKLVAIGGVLGVAGAFAATRLFSGLLYGVRATDAVTYSGVVVLLAVVSVVAAYLPARRAAAVDPITALRCE